MLILCCAFAISGMAALIYQVCWNRLLFAAIGVDLDSTTLVVSAFMLGLGCGSALGAWLAARWRSLGIAVFCGIELLLFAFGVLSARAIDAASEVLVTWPRPLAAVGAFVLLLVPTLLMGATLPVMTEAAQRRPALRHIRFPDLYIYNTLGAALGSLLAGFVLIEALGLRATLFSAALANLAAAAACAALVVRLPRDG